MFRHHDVIVNFFYTGSPGLYDRVSSALQQGGLVLGLQRRRQLGGAFPNVRPRGRGDPAVQARRASLRRTGMYMCVYVRACGAHAFLSLFLPVVHRKKNSSWSQKCWSPRKTRIHKNKTRLNNTLLLNSRKLQLPLVAAAAAAPPTAARPKFGEPSRACSTYLEPVNGCHLVVVSQAVRRFCAHYTRTPAVCNSDCISPCNSW